MILLRRRSLPITPDSDYRLLATSDVEQAAHVLTQAFVDDPLCAYMLPRRKRRLKTLHKFFRVYGEIYIKNQLGYGVGEPLQGIAFWMFPWHESLSISLRSVGKLIPLLFTSYPMGYLRAKDVLKQVDALHKKHAPEPHFYLDNLGVLPGAQGKGLSSRLIRPFLEMADAQKVSVYTDTENRSNVSFYEHFGFRCVEECTIPNAELTVWALRRPVP